MREALDRLEGLAARVVAHLRRLEAGAPAGRAFLGSALEAQARLARERAEVRARLRVAAWAPVEPQSGAAAGTLPALRAAQEELVYAHAEALPLLGDPSAVDRLARHLVELARHLTVIDLWIEAQEHG